MCYIEMHHMRTFLLCGVMTFSYYVMFIHNMFIFKKKAYLVSFPIEDKHVVNEHHVVRKSHDTTQKKCPHVVHFNVIYDQFETNSRHQKCYSEGGKKICGCRILLGRVITNT